MQTYTDLTSVHLSRPTVATIGNFDGVHLGHQVLLRMLQDEAKLSAHNPATAIITFDPHPVKVLRPDLPHHLLTTPQERLQLAGELGIDIGLIQPFNKEVAALEPRTFMGLLKEHLRLCGLVVGPDFALGRDRAGSLDVLTELGKELGYSIRVLEPVDWNSKAVRSSFIRRKLQEGDVAEAADLLGRLYHVMGMVETGDRRGQTLGIPTANLGTMVHKLLPADGVYATRTWLMDAEPPRPFQSVTNLGNRPTVDGLHHRFETHLLDFPAPGDLYGQTLTVEFVTRLRAEQRFDGLDALVAQIHADIAQARDALQAAEQALQLDRRPFFIEPARTHRP